MMEQRKENIVMFPFMAQGHIIPFLALAIELEQKRGRTITFASTPLNIKRIKPSLPPNSSIQLLEIPFRSSDHGLPPDCENTHDLPYHLILKLVEASRSLKPSFHELVYDLVRKQHGRLPLCIISDSFFGWCADIAHELGVFHAIFFPFCAFSTACYYSIGMSLPHRNNESKEFVLADFHVRASRIHVTQMSENLQGGQSWCRDSKEIEEIGVCVQVARGRISEVKSEDIVAKIDLVMNDSEKGKEMRKRACEVRNIINNSIDDKEEFKGASVKAMDDFLNAAMLMREQAKTTP
ncbi:GLYCOSYLTRANSFERASE [Salix viminalis]|uniref:GLYCOSYLTRANSFERASE n=1 Tax=Salix viminalis TaxID=40686 RepID=A0A9Q0TLZ1_SALVM|nr:GLYCOSYLTRANSFERASE [Salix viminalis]